jgi:hypothetical protein
MLFLFFFLYLVLSVDSRRTASTITEDQPSASPLTLPLRTSRAILTPGTRARLSPLQQHLSVCAGETSVTVVDDDASAFLPLLVRCDTGALKGSETWMPLDSIVAVSKVENGGQLDNDNTSKLNKRSKSRILSKFDELKDELETDSAVLIMDETEKEKHALKVDEPRPFGENLSIYFLLSTICICVFVAPKF